MKDGMTDVSRGINRAGILIRFGGAIGLTVMLLVFLTAMKLLNANRIAEQTLRPVESLEEIASPPPPPPPQATTASPSPNEAVAET